MSHCITTPWIVSWPDYSVYGISQARILERVAIPSSRDLPDPGIEPMSLMSSALAGRFFTTNAPWEAHVCVFKDTQLSEK